MCACFSMGRFQRTEWNFISDEKKKMSMVLVLFYFFRIALVCLQ